MEKEVKTSPSHKNFYLFILNKINEGIRPSKIAEENNISKQKINYYIRQLKENGNIIKKGYGTWEVKNLTLNTLTFKNKYIRGHAFIWQVKIPLEIKGLIQERIKGLKIKFVGKEKFPRIIINNKKIWIGKKNIIIYETKSFYANNPTNSRKYAVNELLDTIKELENKLHLKITPLYFKPSREHYGMIKNDLAIQCNKNKEKIYVRDDIEGEWLWIDDSLNIGELETGGTKALIRGTQVQDWWNDNKKHNFKVTPSFILEAMNGIQENQTIFDKNIVKHQKVLDEMLITLKLIQEGLYENKKS